MNCIVSEQKLTRNNILVSNINEFFCLRSHRRTRVVVEQTFGQLKRRFPCLSLGMRVSPERACMIIKACCILFNISKSLREPDFDDPDEDSDDNQHEDDGIQYNGPLHDGTVKRNELINRYF